MSGIRTRAAAAMLAVSPNTLRSWERRYGFPQPMRSAGGHRQYALTEIEALRSALSDTHDVSSAVALVQQRGAGPSSGRRLADALRDFNEDAANCLLAESLALRSIERTIEDVLLEAVAAIADRDPLTPEYEFAWRYATGWMAALKRLSPPARLPQGVLVLDASSPLELDALHAQALELVLRRAGLRTLTLSPAQFLALRSRGGLHTFATPGAEWSHLDLVQSGFLVEAAVRRALAYATPKQELLRSVYLGLGAIADADCTLPQEHGLFLNYLARGVNRSQPDHCELH